MRPVGRRVYIIAYMVIGIAIALLYIPTRQYMIAQDAWVWVIQSDVTLNLIIFLFLYGLLADRFTKKLQPKWKGWLVWACGMVALVMFFQFVGGYQTIWQHLK